MSVTPKQKICLYETHDIRLSCEWSTSWQLSAASLGGYISFPAKICRRFAECFWDRDESEEVYEDSSFGNKH